MVWASLNLGLCSFLHFAVLWCVCLSLCLCLPVPPVQTSCFFNRSCVVSNIAEHQTTPKNEIWKEKKSVSPWHCKKRSKHHSWILRPYMNNPLTTQHYWTEGHSAFRPACTHSETTAAFSNVNMKFMSSRTTALFMRLVFKEFIVIIPVVFWRKSSSQYNWKSQP